MCIFFFFSFFVFFFPFEVVHRQDDFEWVMPTLTTMLKVYFQLLHWSLCGFEQKFFFHIMVSPQTARKSLQFIGLELWSPINAVGFSLSLSLSVLS